MQTTSRVPLSPIYSNDYLSSQNTTGSPLNRVSFLRPDTPFLSAAFKHPSTRFLLFNNLWPLLKTAQSLTYVSLSDIKSITGEDPYSKPEADLINEFDSTKYTPQLVFLGLDERKEALEKGLTWKEYYKGQPYFALDVTPKGSIKDAAEALIKAKTEGDDKSYFAQGRMHLSLPAQEAAIYAEARHMLDWNNRNPFCAQCGYPTMSVNGGFKRTCPPKDLAKKIQGQEAEERPPCATRQGISNLSFPRTDPTVIMAVVSSDGEKILLGRQKRWPQYWYSTLAGFLEPAESVEEAVRREVWEESGIHLGRVVIHSTQPWPYPANLMIGAIGQALPGDSGRDIHLGHDAELDDARWFSREEVLEALRVGTAGLGETQMPEGYVEGNLKLPPATAIANQLIRSVMDGFAGGGESKI